MGHRDRSAKEFFMHGARPLIVQRGFNLRTAVTFGAVISSRPLGAARDAEAAAATAAKGNARVGRGARSNH